MNKTLFYGIFLSAILVSGALGFSIVFADQDDAKNKGKLGLTISGPDPKEALIDSKIKVTVAATSSTNKVDDLVNDVHLKWMSKNGGTIINQNTDWHDGDAIDENPDANFKQISFEITADQSGEWEVWISFTKDGKVIESKHDKFKINGEETSIDKPPQISTEIIQMSLVGAGPPIQIPPPGEKGEKGDKGDKGDTGEQGPPVEFDVDSFFDIVYQITGVARNPDNTPILPDESLQEQIDNTIKSPPPAELQPGDMLFWDGHSHSFSPAAVLFKEPTVTQRFNSVPIPERTIQTVIADCLDNEVVTGGGFSHTIPTAFIHVSENRQVGNGWQVTGYNEANGDVGEILTAYAYCMNPDILNPDLLNPDIFN